MRPLASQSRDPVEHPGRWAVIVVGGGHAGCEAALASARCGLPTLLLTQNVDRIGWMSCNPAIGGIGKSHIVAEIDALGGEMARNTDKAGVHYKELNGSRGAAVRALRVQCDKLAYATAMRRTLETTPNLLIKQADVTALALEGERLAGVVTATGLKFTSSVVILTAGTFLEAVLHTGLQQQVGGRAGDPPSRGLGGQLRALGVRTLRHKTGTCPRLDGRTIDWARTEPDPGLTEPPPLHRGGPGPILPQMPCHMVRTTRQTHDIIRESLDRSPMFTGVIEGTGPRYCPSIEDKVVRFASHDSHYLFLEREGWSTDEIYVNGLSTSLPADAQIRMVRSIPGLEQAEIVRFGYAVEYDAIDARELGRDLMLPALPGLYLAGQVNGTSGYEEAAGQGLVAGLNAVARLKDQEPLHFSRTESYLGVMVDDLVTRGADEPYRMFTSRAEHRLTLRCSNADLRLADLGRRVGLLDEAAWQAVQQRRQRLETARRLLAETQVRPTREAVQHLEAQGVPPIVNPASLEQILCRQGATWQTVLPWLPAEVAAGLDGDDQQELLTSVRYAGYVEREQVRLLKAERQEHVTVPVDLDYSQVGGLSAEAQQKLARVRPVSLGQAGRIPGVTPAAVQALAFHLRALRRRTGQVSTTD